MSIRTRSVPDRKTGCAGAACWALTGSEAHAAANATITVVSVLRMRIVVSPRHSFTPPGRLEKDGRGPGRREGRLEVCRAEPGADEPGHGCRLLVRNATQLDKSIAHMHPHRQGVKG